MKVVCHSWFRTGSAYISNGIVDFSVKDGETAGYFRTFSIPNSWKGNRVKIQCESVYSECDVIVNGNIAGTRILWRIVCICNLLLIIVNNRVLSH